MACSTVFDALVQNTEYLDKKLNVIASRNSVWMQLIPRGEFPQNVGLVHTVFTIGRQEPSADEPTWTTVSTTADGSNPLGTCVWNPNTVSVGLNSLTYRPIQRQFQGPVICSDDAIYKFMPSDTWRKYVTKMAIDVQHEWDNDLFRRYRDMGRVTICKNPFTIGAVGGGITGQSQAMSELTQAHLDICHDFLSEETAFDPGNGGFVNWTQVGLTWTILIGQQASNDIATNNDAFRADIQNAQMGMDTKNVLLMRIGQARQIRNFKHLTTQYPPRYNYAGGNYTRINTFLDTAATKGTTSEVNPEWRTAVYEGATILIPQVMVAEAVRPVTRIADMTWDARSYTGDWKFIIGAQEWDPTCADPFRKLGRHISEITYAPRPDYPQFAIHLIFRRCGINTPDVFCS